MAIKVPLGSHGRFDTRELAGRAYKEGGIWHKVVRFGKYPGGKRSGLTGGLGSGKRLVIPTVW